MIHRLEFVRKKQENGEVYSFFFKPTGRFAFKAGQHAFFILPEFNGGHSYSLSSSPEEPEIRFTTRVRAESRHKQRLARLQPGEKMTVFGPLLWFVFKPEKTDYVFLAQGIGITPFRSLLLHAFKAKLKVNTRLIHVDSHGHTFKDETAKLTTEAQYPTNPEAFDACIAAAVTQHADALYYLSGSPAFVRQTKAKLRAQGIKSRQFKTDTFLGY